VPERKPSSSVQTGLLVVAAMAVVMWLQEIIDQVADAGWDRYGIRPRDTDGLEGIVTAPFLHGGFEHLIGNTVPFLLLGAAIAFGGVVRVAVVSVTVIVVGGLGTWLIAPENTVHIGASGLVFGFASYLVARGAFSRSLAQVLLGVAVLAVWGTTLLRGLVPEDGISWQGHLFGAVGGVVAAWLLERRRTRVAAPAPTG
jgi:membrane associated rhomboid family serine protease